MKSLFSAIASAIMMSILFAGCAGADPSAEGEEDENVAEAQQALPGTKCTTYFYDAPNGNVVGYCTIACSGGARCWGIQTAYHDQDCESCVMPSPEQS